MNKTTTQKDLILYAYNESDLSDSDLVQRKIDGDPIIQQEFNEMVNAIRSLDSILLEPSEKSIEAIFAFAGKYQA